MRIAINTLSVEPSRARGGETYLRSLVHHIAKVDQGNNTYLLLVRRSNADAFAVKQPNFILRYCPSLTFRPQIRILWEQLALPLLLNRHKIDVLYSPSNTAPLFLNCALVLGLQSMHYHFTPEELGALRTRFSQIMVPLSAKRADRVIAVSRSIGETLQRLAHIEGRKIAVIHEGTDFPDDGNRTVVPDLGGYELPRPYILFVGALLKYKNADKAILALRSLRELGLPHKLVIVGPDYQSNRQRFEELAERIGIRDSVLFVGPVPHEQVYSFYMGADVLVYPSAMETFGLPVLEAMACGCPVVASNASSLPEVVGEAGILVSPEDVGELSNAIYRIITNRSLREELVRRGLERVKLFTWDRAARETIAVLEEVGAMLKTGRTRKRPQGRLS